MFIVNGISSTGNLCSGMQALHRLILSGTPIQNNVLELWGLFEWLMPGLFTPEKLLTLILSMSAKKNRNLHLRC